MTASSRTAAGWTGTPTSAAAVSGWSPSACWSTTAGSATGQCCWKRPRRGLTARTRMPPTWQPCAACCAPKGTTESGTGCGKAEARQGRLGGRGLPVLIVETEGSADALLDLLGEVPCAEEQFLGPVNRLHV